MKLFARLMFNRAWIVLQPVDMPLQAAIFTLQLLHLQEQAARISPLGGKSGEAVVTEDHAIGHEQRQNGSNQRGSATTPKHQLHVPAPADTIRAALARVVVGRKHANPCLIMAYVEHNLRIIDEALEA